MSRFTGFKRYIFIFKFFVTSYTKILRRLSLNSFTKLEKILEGIVVNW